jgi:hypothetical protein
MEPKRIVIKIIALSSTVLTLTLTLNAAPLVYPLFSLSFPTDTLVGYSGGPICSDSTLCAGPNPYTVSGLLGPDSFPVAFVTTGNFMSVQPGVFDLSGTMTDGAVLGGTMTIDEATGLATAINITVYSRGTGLHGLLKYRSAKRLHNEQWSGPLGGSCRIARCYSAGTE